MIRDGDKFEKILAQILVTGVKSGSVVTVPGHTAHGATLACGGTGSERHGG
jgi:hypothetical protein